MEKIPEERKRLQDEEFLTETDIERHFVATNSEFWKRKQQDMSHTLSK